MNYFTRLFCLLILIFVHSGFTAQTINLTSSPQYVRIGDLDIAGSQITVEALVKFTGGVNIVSKHTGPPNVNYLMRIGTFEITTTTQFNLMINPYAGAMQPNTWYHVAGTYDGSFVRYYVNGCLIVQQAASGTIVQNNLVTGIGNISSAPNGEQFYGEIDELRIWDVARSASELTANMFDLPNPTSYPNLKGYYKFDGNVLNIQGNATYNGVWVGTPSYGTQPLPNVIPTFSVQSATPTDVSCFGSNDGSITVSATGNNLQYSLDNSTWQASNSFTGLAPQNYIVYTRTPEGCVITQNNVTINAPAQVTATATNTGSYCPGETIQLHGSTTSGGTITYSWTGPGGYSSSVQNPTDATAAGTYNLTVIADGCSSPVASTTVTLKPTPDATASNTGPYCAGQNLQLNGSTTATGTNSFAWTGPNGYSSNLQNPTNATVAGDYHLTVTSDGCASSVSTTTVALNPQPSATASNTGPYCTGQAIQLNGSTTSTGTNSFTWTGPGGYTSTVQNPTNATAAGIYTLSVSSSGCQSASSSTTVVINPIPSATANNGGPYCAGNPIQLNGNTNASGTIGYNWTGPGSYSSTFQNPTDATIGGVYNLTVTANGCNSSVASTSVVIKPTPIASASNTGPYCSGAAVQLNGSTSSIGVPTYTWSGPGGYTSSAQNPTDATFAGTYNLTVTIDGCPSATVTTLVSITPTPIANASNGGPYCEGEIMQLSGNTTATGTNSFSWTGPNGFTSSSQNPNVTEAGTYTLIVTSNGCLSTAVSTNVIVHPNPDVIASNTGPYYAGQTSQLNATTSVAGNVNYNWTGPAGYTSNVQNPTNAMVEGIYTVLLTDANGCTASSSTMILYSNVAYLIVPNVFTPNGDGSNDLFYVQQEGIKDLTCSIFNRWGEKIYEITTKEGSWDGKFNGKDVTDGVYFYILSANDYNENPYSEKGYFHIIR